MNTVRTWYLEGIDFSEAPASLGQLAAGFEAFTIEASLLRKTAKWEPLLRGHTSVMPSGWVPLSELAGTKRGTATGSNGFFLLSRDRVKALKLPLSSVVDCVGRAGDVAGVEFTREDFERITAEGAKTQLLDIKGPVSDAEQAYIDMGAAEGLPARYLLKTRKPWYSMESGKPAPIWAAVFGRGTLKFVHNAAGVRSLTNFHGIYPQRGDVDLARALTYCLNAPVVVGMSASTTRNYGGGLKKYEPNDLKSIPVPDLRLVCENTLRTLARALSDLHNKALAGKTATYSEEHNELVIRAGEEAAASAPVAKERQLDR